MYFRISSLDLVIYCKGSGNISYFQNFWEIISDLEKNYRITKLQLQLGFLGKINKKSIYLHHII